MDIGTIVADNLRQVRQRMAEAAKRAGRAADSVRLIAVTKYVEADVIRHIVAAGCRDLGESRPQALWKKHEELADLAVRWHLIGHLQTNKVRRTLKLARLECVESADRLPLLESLQTEADKSGRSLDVLLEVRVSPDPTKHGFSRDELPSVIRRFDQWPALRLRGLMTMASLQADEAQTRREFQQLRVWRDELVEEMGCAESLHELSMGMSRDFEIAIECGSTIVRVGSALVEGVVR